MKYQRWVALALAGALLGAVARSMPTPHPMSTPRPISIAIDGVLLPLNPPPRIDHGVLFVPVRRTIEALGLDYTKSGPNIITHVGARTITLTKGSRLAHIDDSSILLDAPLVEIKFVLYAPLRFFTQVLGAQANFNRKAHAVTIVSQLVGRLGSGTSSDAGQTIHAGTVSAVDVNSDPPTLTLSNDETLRTIPIGANADIEMHDIDAHVTSPGELAAIAPGDFAKVTMAKNGHVKYIEDEFGSRTGRIAAIGAGEFVLDSGQVIAPDRFTQILLNAVPAQLAALRVGDRAAVRYNVETNEIREVLVSRAITTTNATTMGPQITSVTTSIDGALRAGSSFTVTLKGTPGAEASVDFGSYVTGLAMSESSPGIYQTQYTIPRGATFTDVPIIGQLRAAGVNAPPIQAAQTLWASSSPPGITAVAPRDGATVNATHPAIYATFASDAVGVNPSSIELRVDGHDVTSECVRTAAFIQYMPKYSYPPGVTHVTVSVSDHAGNTTTRSWTFRIVR